MLWVFGLAVEAKGRSSDARTRDKLVVIAASGGGKVAQDPAMLRSVIWQLLQLHYIQY